MAILLPSLAATVFYKLQNICSGLKTSLPSFRQIARGICEGECGSCAKFLIASAESEHIFNNSSSRFCLFVCFLKGVNISHERR